MQRRQLLHLPVSMPRRQQPPLNRLPRQRRRVGRLELRTHPLRLPFLPILPRRRHQPPSHQPPRQ